MRTFIAIEIPEQLRERLVSVRSALAASIADEGLASLLRWSDRDNYHLTLRFLGETKPAQRLLIGKMLGGVADAYPPFSLALDGLGAFPHWRKMRVLWVGMAGEMELLARLQGSVEAGVQGCGFAAERQNFHPHATLARVSREADNFLIAQVGALLATQTKVAQSLGHWKVSELILMRSDLQRSGAIYTPVDRFPLAG